MLIDHTYPRAAGQAAKEFIAKFPWDRNGCMLLAETSILCQDFLKALKELVTAESLGGPSARITALRVEAMRAIGRANEAQALELASRRADAPMSVDGI